MRESLYGLPCVSNPHDFDPDHECCSPEEIDTRQEAHVKLGCVVAGYPGAIPAAAGER